MALLTLTVEDVFSRVDSMVDGTETKVRHHKHDKTLKCPEILNHPIFSIYDFFAAKPQKKQV